MDEMNHDGTIREDGTGPIAPEAESGKGRLHPVTVRLTREAWAAANAVAAKNGIPCAAFIRLALSENLNKYLGDIQVVDYDEAVAIRKAIMLLYGEVSKVQNELHRIGVNYNQEIKLRRIEQKYKGSNDPRMEKEKDAVLSECQGFNPAALDELMTRYEVATKEVGDMLCRFLV